MEITDSMTTGATSLFEPWPLLGAVKKTHEVVDSDRGEFILEFADCIVLVSCDPIVHDDQGVPISRDDPSYAERWEVVIYDATETEAGKAIRAASD